MTSSRRASARGRAENRIATQGSVTPESGTTAELRVHVIWVEDMRFVVFESSTELDARSASQLTETERVVAGLAVGGHGPGAIAAARGVAYRTVANQLAAIYRKLRVNSRAELRYVLQAETPGMPRVGVDRSPKPQGVVVSNVGGVHRGLPSRHA